METIQLIITVGELHTVLSYNEHIECQQSYLVFFISNCSFSVFKQIYCYFVFICRKIRNNIYTKSLW